MLHNWRRFYRNVWCGRLAEYAVRWIGVPSLMLPFSQESVRLGTCSCIALNSRFASTRLRYNPTWA